MDNFTFNLPTKIIYTDDEFKALEDALKAIAPKKLLLVYGMHSLKEKGIYQGILKVLETLKLPHFEVSEIPANPTLSKVHEAYDLIKKESIDFILAAGGGSVMDAAKAMAISKDLKKEEIWDAYERKTWFKTTIPLGVFVTLSGTGSEVNGNSVLNNDFTNVKWSIADPLLRPHFAIINPKYQEGLKSDAFMATSLDIIHHTFEQFFDDTKNTSTSDYLMMGLIKSVRQNLNDVLNDTYDLDTYKNLTWASTLGLSFLFQQGKKGAWESHRISYPLTARFGIIHGYALTMVIPAFLTYVYSFNIKAFNDRLDFVGEELFNGSKGLETIEKIKELYRFFKAPVSYQEAGILKPSKEVFKEMAQDILSFGDLGKFASLDEKALIQIYDLIEV
jgi:alcohol dehydrogenase YqhD (iron-dependent ADH family)